MEGWKAGRREGWRAARAGRLEGWRAEGLEGWRAGRLEGWRAGRLEGWKAGRLEGWKAARLEGWKAGWKLGWKVGGLEGKRGTERKLPDVLKLGGPMPLLLDQVQMTCLSRINVRVFIYRRRTKRIHGYCWKGWWLFGDEEHGCQLPLLVRPVIAARITRTCLWSSCPIKQRWR